jgi:bifunctional DNA-binding transcriptional regulator/antitoxin component of YhaV-PrlF toxin-antitoxin module
VTNDDLGEYLVSASGQVSVPAAFRRRWGLEYGGPVTMIDVGEALMLLPAAGRERMLDRALDADEHLEFVRGLDDPDLETT